LRVIVFVMQAPRAGRTNAQNEEKARRPSPR